MVSISETTPIDDAATIMKNFNSIERKRFLRVGKILMNPIVEVGLNGEDFVRNRKSFRITYDCFRIPRFINPLHKKY